MMRRLRTISFAVAISVAAVGCSGVDGSVLPKAARSYIVGVDISGSRTQNDLAESKQLLNQLIEPQVQQEIPVARFDAARESLTRQAFALFAI